MMVEFGDTVVAGVTVTGFGWSHDFAGVTVARSINVGIMSTIDVKTCFLAVCSLLHGFLRVSVDNTRISELGLQCKHKRQDNDN